MKNQAKNILKNNTTAPAMWQDMLEAIIYHHKQGNLKYPVIIVIALQHIFAIAGFIVIPKCSAETLMWAFLLWPVSCFGVTVGVHRLWSHRSYQASFSVRLFLMLANSIANQGTIYHWARDHRVHHKYVETDADPHNAKRGFFFSHIGWLLVKKHPDVIQAGKFVDCSDLEEDSLVMFQKRFHPWFPAFMCFIFPAQVASYGWGENFWIAMLVAGFLRYCTYLHFTFLVNSAAHYYGDHPYDHHSYATENPIVSFLTAGEGWHNWHHKYPYDYAASEFGVSSQYNPSKLLIDIFAKCGLVWGRKRATGAWEMGKKRRDNELNMSAQGNKASSEI